MMKVAIDTGPLTSGHRVRGIGVHTTELIKELELLAKKKKGFDLISFDFSDKNRFVKEKFDIVHYPYFNPFFVTLPFKSKERMVVTIHDLIPLIYPKAYPPGIKGNIKLLLHKSLVKRTDRVITISETSKKDIIRFLKIPAEMIDVIHLAPKRIYRQAKPSENDLARIQKKYKLPPKFILYLGDVNYNKNVISLIKACKLIDTHLVLVGKQAADLSSDGIQVQNNQGPRDMLRSALNVSHPELAHYRELMEEFNSNKKIIRPGFIPDEEMVGVFKLAAVYCQPSYYEGFGIPVLEAMAAGTPVVASKIQALVEIAENAALFADPNEPKDIAEKVGKILKSGRVRKQLREKGFKNLKRFSWEKTAELTLQVYERAHKRAQT